ncbi:MAG TPA: hypothetical protein VN765_06705 [Candidatus Acidoferrum sp.]|nr:hypothetical protein [Candidatus Acidoferrum sp.]
MHPQKSKPVHPEVRIGHVHLKVADLDRALAFYRDLAQSAKAGDAFLRLSQSAPHFPNRQPFFQSAKLCALMLAL